MVHDLGEEAWLVGPFSEVSTRARNLTSLVNNEQAEELRVPNSVSKEHRDCSALLQFSPFIRLSD
jgi:hypothetical protein